jgi:hypothetical protein
MPRLTIRPKYKYFLLLLIFLGAATIVGSQDTTQVPTGAPAPASPKANTVPMPTQATPQKASGPLSDYVPCIFDGSEQFDMRAATVPPTPQQPLDIQSAQQLLDSIDVALSQILGQNFEQNPEFLKAFNDYYRTNLTSAQLFGLTPDQANAHIQSVLVHAVETAAQSAAANKHLLTDSELDLKRSQAANDLMLVVNDAIDAYMKQQKAKKPPAGEAADFNALLEATIQAIQNAIGTYNFSQEFVTEVIANYRQYASPNSNRSYFPNLETNDASRLKVYLQGAVKQAALSTKSYPFVAASSVDVSNTLTQLKASLGASASQAVKGTEAKQFQAPADVSCSMAVMSWKETRDIFGRRVANTYVAIQVTLRNLNTKNEFLVHDIQVAIDTGVTADYFGRFQAGRDKLLVRAVAQRGQAEDRRNRVLNILQATGAIAGAASLSTGVGELKDAVAVFQGAFIPGFSNIFPDHTVEQLNHINDLVFSASNTSKVLVPIQGSVPLVTFISEKPIEQLPFAWCGYPLRGRGGSRSVRSCDFNGGKKNPGYVTPYPNKGSTQTVENSGETTSSGTRDNVAGTAQTQDTMSPWDELEYKDWKAAALRMLQEHTFVVVGGVHIQEVVTQPKVGNLDCPTLSSGPVDISQVQDGMVTCTATGTGLNLVSAVALEQGTTKIAGKAKAATDGNSATLQFKPADLSDGVGAYSLFLTYKSGSGTQPTDSDSGESVLLSKQPVITSASITVSTTSATLTLQGKNLDQISEVSLLDDNGGASVNETAQPAPATGGTSATVAFAANLDSTKKYHLSYSIKADPSKNIKSIAVTISAGSTPAPKGEIPAIPPKAKPKAKAGT